MKKEHGMFEFLDAWYVAYCGIQRFAMGDRIEAVPFWAVLPASDCGTEPEDRRQ